MKEKPQGSPQPEAQQEVTRKLGLNRCPFCHDDVSVERNDWVACRDCLARHHSACWEENTACASCGSTTALEARAKDVKAPLTAKQRKRAEDVKAPPTPEQRNLAATKALGSLGGSMRPERSGLPMFLGIVGVVVLFALLVVVWGSGSSDTGTESMGWPYEGSPTMTAEEYSAMTQKKRFARAARAKAEALRVKAFKVEADKKLLHFLRVNAQGLEAISLEDLGSVKSITLTNVSDGDLENLRAAARSLPALEELVVRGKLFTGKGLRNVGRLRTLRRLDLSGSLVETLEAFPELLPLLEELNLSNTLVTRDDLRGTIVSSAPELKTLNLSGTRITGLGNLTMSMKNLHTLDLSKTLVVDVGLLNVARFSKLERLDLSETAITDQALDRLHALSALRWLNLEGTTVSEEGIERLRAALPELEVVLKGS